MTQPPVGNRPLYDYLQRLKAEAEAINNPSKPKNDLADQSIYLDSQIKAWILKLTPDQLLRRYGVWEIIRLADLAGKYREKPALQQVAYALRANGFISKRSWTNASCNQRYWIYKKGSNNA